MHNFLSKLFLDRKDIFFIFQIRSDFLCKTTRGNTINLKWSPLNWGPKFSSQKEVQFPPHSSPKDYEFQHIYTHCCLCLGVRERDAKYQCMHRMLCLLCSLSVASQGVALLPFCACPALAEGESLLEHEGMTQWGGSLQQGQILADAWKKQKMTEPSLWSKKFFLSDPETPRVRLCKTAGSISQLAATKSECFVLFQKAGGI